MFHAGAFDTNAFDDTDFLILADEEIKAGSDTGALISAESATVAVFIESIDQDDLLTNDVATVDSAGPNEDTGTISATEEPSVSAVVTASDDASIDSTETSNIDGAANVVNEDATTLDGTETSTLVKVDDIQFVELSVIDIGLISGGSSDRRWTPDLPVTGVWTPEAEEV